MNIEGTRRAVAVDVIPDRRRARPAADAQPLRLLVVDDDANDRAYLAVLARRVGFTVEAASDGEAALPMLAGGAFDVVIVDHEMPRLRGIDLVRALREDEATRAIYALMLTAHGDLATKLAAIDAGFDDFVTKASAEAEIVARLTAARRIAARQRTMNVTIRELYGLATRDDLTGLFNRRFFMAEAERLLGEGLPLSAILFDLDAFKQINDTHGHLAGDAVLRDVGALFQRSTRPADIVARFGGDEFVMVVPHLDARSIEGIAARLARRVRALVWTAGEATFGIGVSTGIGSTLLLTEPTLARLLDAADRDLYQNKWLRRNPDRAKSRDRRTASPESAPAPR